MDCSWVDPTTATPRSEPLAGDSDWATGRVLCGVVLLFTVLSVQATPPQGCQEIYSDFQTRSASIAVWDGNVPTLAAIAMGRLAWNMERHGCWPALQGAGMAALPAITNCSSLEPHVFEFGRAYDQDPGWHWLKVYEPRPVPDKPSRSETMALMSAMMSAPVSPNGSRVLACIGKVQTAGNGLKSLYFYLDRDADGEEFYGYTYYGYDL